MTNTKADMLALAERLERISRHLDEGREIHTEDAQDLRRAAAALRATKDGEARR